MTVAEGEVLAGDELDVNGGGVNEVVGCIVVVVVVVIAGCNTVQLQRLLSYVLGGPSFPGHWSTGTVWLRVLTQVLVLDLACFLHR